MWHIRGKQHAGAIARVGTGRGEDYREYEDRATVKHLIMEINSAHFRLTKDTPPMQAPLLSDLGYLANTEAAERILNGTYVCPPGTDDFTCNFLQCLQCLPNGGPEDRILMMFTWDDFCDYWKKWKELTSSSHSSLHFHHYKVVIKNDTLSEMHVVFVDIAVNSGYSPMHWQHGLTVMLEKKKGVILVSKLCAILLMEANFNYANKTIFGRRMMFFAQDRQEVAEECSGSRRYHEATDIALNCHLFCNIARQKWCSVAISCTDLEQCYNCIAHSIASLGDKQWGVPVQAITCLLTTSYPADGLFSLNCTWQLGCLLLSGHRHGGTGVW